AAAEPFKSGLFGTYLGTPTFIVIAPDRSVQYDVRGQNSQLTIDSLEEAITATGAEKLSSAIPEPDQKLLLSLNCNIVRDKLTLEYLGEPTQLNTTLLNLLGQIYTSANFPIEQNTSVEMDVSGLTAGLWAIRVQDRKTNIVASYLFLKQ
ncbi:MAG: hypothetical protein ABIQ02_05585, partial [Saprospiraceae bacterium]